MSADSSWSQRLATPRDAQQAVAQESSGLSTSWHESVDAQYSQTCLREGGSLFSRETGAGRPRSSARVWSRHASADSMSSQVAAPGVFSHFSTSRSLAFFASHVLSGDRDAQHLSAHVLK